MYSVYYKKRVHSASILRNSIFDTAELVAGCGSLFNPAAEVASLIIKKPCHFGAVSYKQRLWPEKRPV